MQEKDYHGCLVRIEKSVSRDHCLASLVIPISDPRTDFFRLSGSLFCITRDANQ